MTLSNVALAHLYSLRAHLDAVIIAAESEAGVNQAAQHGACPKCGTPSEQLIDTSTLDGTKRRRCPNCGEEWEL